MSMPIFNLEIQQPKLGNKICCIEQHGTYVLERGACSLRGMANTRIGNGAISIYDCLPEEDGRIPSNAKLIFNACPPILGMYMFDGGCDLGLTVVLHGSGGMNNLPPCITFTWAAYREQKRRIEHA
jgi:hypothetical protein